MSAWGRFAHFCTHVALGGRNLAVGKARAVFLSDLGMSDVKYADAGYKIAKRVARERGVDMPSLD